MQDLKELFAHLLQDVYFAEHAITKALPKMIKASKSPELSELFSAHLKETEGQIDRLEQVFQLIGMSPKAKKCQAIEGIIAEADDDMSEADSDEIRHAGMLADAQTVEHYEMARYGTLIAWADELGVKDAIPLLEKTLEQEKAADAKLTKLSRKINDAAMAA